jgi:S1-C subfamily serine protease
VNWLDLFIVLFLVSAVVRGTEVGFIRQFCSTVGFFIGLFAGAWLQALLVELAGSATARALASLLITLGFALTCMTLGEYLGLLAKYRLRDAKITNKLDKILGAGLATITLLAAVWLGASIFRNIPDGSWQRQIQTSRIVNILDNSLPSAPGVLTKLGHLIDPNSFPQVFSGLEPHLKTDAPLPDMGELTQAVQKVKLSIVQIEGEGCDAIVEGSGFVTGKGEVVTNAHVVAGVKAPYVLDQKGRHGAQVVLFNPDLDLAVLRTDTLVGEPLPIEAKSVASTTAVAALGYPLGAGLTATPGVVLESFPARGRNIYNQGDVVRQVYSVKTDIKSGNSGGPLINKDGSVVGVVFAKSVNYDHIGYALTMDQVQAELTKARQKTGAVSTWECAAH